MADKVKRILGLDFDGNPIFAPKHSHSISLSSSGSGKTTAGVLPWLQSLIADENRALKITDSKDGEVASQAIDMCIKAGRKVALVDPFGKLGEDNPYRVSLNPFGGVVSAFHKNNGTLLFATENACQALIEEPSGDARNQYWRDEPRTLIEFSLNTLLKRHPRLATPGGVWSMISDPDSLLKMAVIEADEGDIALSALARHVIGMSKAEEHFPQHRAAATKAMRVFSADSALHHVGVDSTISHETLLREKYITFIVGPVKYMDRLSAFYALHLESFMDALLSDNGTPVTFILEEFTNAPLASLTSKLTTIRGFSGSVLMVAQSLSEVERKYGKKETETILENAVIKQYLGFSSYEEAEKISRAIGETLIISSSLGFNSDKLEFSGNVSTNKERLYTPDMLMSLPDDEQIIHVKDVGFIHCKKIRQNEIAPSCHYLTDNPLEGGRLPPNPKVTLPFPNEGNHS